MRRALQELLEANPGTLSAAFCSARSPTTTVSARRRGRPSDPVGRTINDLALIADVILLERAGESTTRALDIVGSRRFLSGKAVQNAMYRRLGGLREALEALEDADLEALAARFSRELKG